MLFSFEEEWNPVAGSISDKNTKLTGCLWLKELEESYTEYGLTDSVIEECHSNQLFYRKGMLTFEESSFFLLPIIDRESQKEESDRFGVFLSKDQCFLILIEDSKKKTEAFFVSIMEKCKTKKSVSKILYWFLDGLLEQDAIVLENMDFRITRMEEKLVKERLMDGFHRDIFQMKRELLLLRSYYEQLLEIGERLYENENHILPEEEREQFKIFTERVKRFRENVILLKENLVEVREAYESFMDLSMNSIMKIFTVVTTVFLPLSLMAGWYGMNFKYMPELQSRYGYPGFIIASIMVLIGCLLFFKIKKFI